PPMAYGLCPTNERGDIRRSTARRVIPSGGGDVEPDRAERDVVERRRGLGVVDHRAGEAEAAAVRALGPRPDALPRRSARARAADDLLRAAHDHAVARVGVRV